MSRRILVAVVSLYGVALCDEPKTPEQKQVAKECASVPDELVNKVRDMSRIEAPTHSHGFVVTEARKWVKDNKHENAIPDACVAAVVREVMTQCGRTDDQLREKQKASKEADKKREWEQLTELEKLWVLLLRVDGTEPRLTGYSDIRVGAIGSFSPDASLRVLQVLSDSDVIVEYKNEDIWLAGADTSRFIDRKSFRAPSGVFWIPRTTTYETLSGGTRTIYYCELLENIDPAKLIDIVPPADALAELTNRDGRHAGAPITRATSKTDVPTFFSGSGFLVGRSLVVTNYHVIHEAKTIHCFVSGASFDASMIAHDKQTDLALLTLEKEPAPASPVLKLGNSANIAQGERVFAMGYPLTDVLGKDLHVHEGIISSVVGFEGSASEFQVGMSLNPGNSGGPLLDVAGRVVGIVRSKLGARYVVQADTIPEGVTFAIKADLLGSLISAAGVSGQVQYDTEPRTPMTLADLASQLGKAIIRIEVSR